MAANAATVTGTVTSAATGGALNGMIVAAYDSIGNLHGTASTDGTGLYVLTLPAGDYRFLAYDPAGVYATAFDTNAESFETSPLHSISSSGAQLSFTLVKGGFVKGTVRTAVGPLAQAMVEAYNLSGSRRGFAATNSNGNYRLVLPPGEFKLVAYDATGVYAVVFHRSVRSFDEATPVQVIEATEIDVAFTLAAAAHVSGTAIDAVTRLPLASILVYAYTSAGALVSQTTTLATGAFRFSLPAGDYRFIAADASRVYATAYYDGSRSFEGASVITVAAGEQRQGMQLALTRGARITGHVNAPNLTAAAYNLDGTLHASTTSDAAGSYALVVAPGEFRIAVSDPSLTYAMLFYGGTTDFRFAQRLSVTGDIGGIDVTLPRGGRVGGTVSSNDSELLAGITVAAYDASGMLAATGITSSAGRYVVVVAPGTCRFVVSDAQLRYATSYAGGATSYETCSPQAVEADAKISADFTMHRGVRVNGVVACNGVGALTGIDVFALDVAGNRVASTVSKDGAFTIVVVSGTYRFIAVDPFRRYASAAPSPELVVVEGQTPPALTLWLTSNARRRSVRH